jgi:hypothetical protein
VLYLRPRARFERATYQMDTFDKQLCCAEQHRTAMLTQTNSYGTNLNSGVKRRWPDRRQGRKPGVTVSEASNRIGRAINH